MTNTKRKRELNTKERMRRLLLHCLSNLEKFPITDEALRQMLTGFYDAMMALDDMSALASNIDVLDAMKDCLRDNKDGMEEWSINADGVVRFR